MSVTYDRFIQEKDLLLAAKPDQPARGVAADLVHAMELIAVHGSTGIAADPDTREDYIEALQARIIATRNIRSGFERAFAPRLAQKPKGRVLVERTEGYIGSLEDLPEGSVEGFR